MQSNVGLDVLGSFTGIVMASRFAHGAIWFAMTGARVSGTATG